MASDSDFSRSPSDCEVDENMDVGNERTSLDVMISQAQNVTQESPGDSFITFTGLKKTSKRSRTSIFMSGEEDADGEESDWGKRVNRYGESKGGSVVVILRSPDVNLAAISPMKIAKVLNDVGRSMVKKVSKIRNKSIAVTCFTSSQAVRIKALKTLGEWTVETEYPKSEIESKGVISGIPLDIDCKEIMEECKWFGVVDVRRLKFKKDGKLEDSRSICITFNQKTLPAEIRLGYESYPVRPYVAPVVRCFKCQIIGHTASVCGGKVRCVRCGGPHEFKECNNKDSLKCVRCGGKHSAAYEGCEVIRMEKKIQQVRANKRLSYVEAARTVREASYVEPAGKGAFNDGNLVNSHGRGDESGGLFYQSGQTQLRVVKKVQERQNIENQVTVCDAHTQTKVDQYSQTENVTSTTTSDVAKMMGPELAKVLVGAMQIFDMFKGPEERERAIDDLIQHTYFSKSETRSKRTRSSPSKSGNSTGNMKQGESQSEGDQSGSESRRKHSEMSSQKQKETSSNKNVKQSGTGKGSGSGSRGNNGGKGFNGSVNLTTPPLFSFKTCEYKTSGGNGSKYSKNGKKK